MYTSVQKTPKYDTHFRRKYRDKNHNQQVLNEGVYGKLRERLMLIGKGSVRIRAFQQAGSREWKARQSCPDRRAMR